MSVRVELLLLFILSRVRTIFRGSDRLSKYSFVFGDLFMVCFVHDACIILFRICLVYDAGIIVLVDEA